MDPAPQLVSDLFRKIHFLLLFIAVSPRMGDRISKSRQSGLEGGQAAAGNASQPGSKGTSWVVTEMKQPMESQLQTR